MTDEEREALCREVEAALPEGYPGMRVGVGRGAFGEDTDVLRCKSVAGYKMWVGNEYETLFLVTGTSEEDCVRRLREALKGRTCRCLC